MGKRGSGRIFAAFDRLGCSASGDDRWQGHMALDLFGVDYIPLFAGTGTDGKSFGLTDYIFGD